MPNRDIHSYGPTTTVYRDKYLDLLERINEIDSGIIWKMLFVYPYTENNLDSGFTFRQGSNCSQCSYWRQMPEGREYWSELHFQVEVSRRERYNAA